MGVTVNILHAVDRVLDDRFWLGVDALLERQGFALEFSHEAQPRAFARLTEGNTPDPEESLLTIRCDEDGQAPVRLDRAPAGSAEVFQLSWEPAVALRLKRRQAVLEFSPLVAPDDSLEFFNALIQAATEMLDGVADDSQAGLLTGADGLEFDYPPETGA